MKAKKLIEVAMPIKEISSESVRDKSIRHGHISTLHLWWARRPLPTCRAVVFASLVPDPLDDNCPQAFKDAVNDILCTGIAKAMYAPYPDIPYTAIYDPMDDNLRNRLLMFIGKFSDKCQTNMIAGKSTSPKEQIQEGCLIKWESKNDETVLNRARKLIYVAYNSERRPEATYAELSEEFDGAWETIKNAEERLYSIPNRHLENPDPNSEVNEAQMNLNGAIEIFQSFMPSVFDPFAGGGAIPLEAARLGCRSYGNDINPVAHIIEKGSVEFPQKYGKPIIYTRDEFIRLYGEDGLELLQDRELEFVNDEVTIANRLSFDVEYYALKLIKMTEAEVGHFYPNDADVNKLVAYYWARTARCSNPSCNAEVPLLKQFYLCNTPSKKVWLNPIINGTDIQFEIRYGACPIKGGWNNRGNLTCPCCGSITSVDKIKEQSCAREWGQRLIADIYNDQNGKTYFIHKVNKYDVTDFSEVSRPKEIMSRNSNGGDTYPWGYTTWGDLFSDRQLYVLNRFVENLSSILPSNQSEYLNVVKTYLAILLDRTALINTSFGRWNVARETIEHPYSRQAISMMFDYPEVNPFSGVTGSVYNQIEWLIRYIESEGSNNFSAICNNSTSGEKQQFAYKSLTAAVTDPPYYDAIAYADISDFFYVWLKRTAAHIYPLSFATPQTPKAEECTALKHHHEGDYDKAKAHFENKLLQIFKAIEEQTTDTVSIMFAHQSTEAWTTLCNSILGSNMNITGSWAMDTERDVRMLAITGDSLASSVTVACRPSERKGYASYKKVKDAIHKTVEEEVRSLYELGFRGADLLTACFGKAVSVFGNYETVEKADGSEVTVAELLEMARTAAFTALVKDFASDEYTKFYIGWLHLNGMGDTKHDDVVKFVRSGTALDISDVYHQNLLVKDESNNTQHLASFAERTAANQSIPQEGASLIDKVHAAMRYWADQDLTSLNALIARDGQDKNNEFWRVLFVLKELLPEGKDREQVTQLLGNADTRIEKAKSAVTEIPKQASLFDDTEF